MPVGEACGIQAALVESISIINTLMRGEERRSDCQQLYCKLEISLCFWNFLDAFLI